MIAPFTVGVARAAPAMTIVRAATHARLRVPVRFMVSVLLGAPRTLRPAKYERYTRSIWSQSPCEPPPDHPGRAPPAPTSTAAIPGFGDGRRVQPGEAGSVRLAIERLDAAPGGRLRRHHVEAVVADVAPGAAECGTRVG